MATEEQLDQLQTFGQSGLVVADDDCLLTAITLFKPTFAHLKTDSAEGGQLRGARRSWPST